MMRRRPGRRTDVGAVVVAGGRGMRRVPDRALLPLAGRTLLARTVGRLLAAPAMSAVSVIVEPADSGAAAAVLAKELPGAPVTLVEGTGVPAQNLHAALRTFTGAIETDEIELILIADTAWPLVSVHLLDEVIAAGRRYGAAAPCLSAPHEIWIDRRGAAVRVPFDRTTVIPQYPQAYAADDLLAGYAREAGRGYPVAAPAEVFERRTGRRVRAVPGESANISIRGPEDMFAAEAILARAGYAS